MQKSKLILLLVFLVISVLTFVTYANTLENPFIWDDTGLIVKNQTISDWHNWPQVFKGSLGFDAEAKSNFYRPLQIISYIWDYHFWKINPYGYHLTNIWLQISVAFLFFLLLAHLLNSKGVAFLSALFFAVSPLNTESVTYISGRAEMLVGLFLILSLLLFIWSKDKTKLIKLTYLFLSYFVFILALFSKELALVFPFIVAAYVFYYRRDDFKGLLSFLKPVLPFIVIVAGYLLLRLILISPSLHPTTLGQHPIILRLTLLSKVIFTYLKLLVFPVNLHMERMLIQPKSFLEIFLSWFALGLIFMACWRVFFYRRENRPLCFLLSWSLIFFIPQSGLFPMNTYIAEHFIYLASISFYVFVVYLLRTYLRKKLFIFLSLIIFTYYSMLTVARNFDWNNPVIFYEKIIKFSPNSFQAHNNLGLEYEHRHDYKRAIFEYKKALEIKPDTFVSRLNLANLYFNTEKYKEAKVEYNQLKYSASGLRRGEIENNLGCIDEVEGLWGSAVDSYKLALKFNPKLNFTHFNLARIYQTQGKLELSAQEMLDSLPELKIFSGKRSDYLAMLKSYIKSSKIFNSRVFYKGLGVEFMQQNMPEAAVASFNRLIELEPYYSDAYVNLGLAYWKQGLKKEAVFAFKSALRISPNHLRAKGFLNEINNFYGFKK